MWLRESLKNCYQIPTCAMVRSFGLRDLVKKFLLQFSVQFSMQSPQSQGRIEEEIEWLSPVFERISKTKIAEASCTCGNFS